MLFALLFLFQKAACTRQASMLRLVVSRHALPSLGRCSTYSTSADTSLSQSIRALMRASAQPVAVITSLLPPEQLSPSTPSTSSYVHGATLSSFSTISLDPPLLAFSLQTPSRMADALQVKYKEAHFVVNILSDKQSDEAAKFSKPGLKPFSLGSDWATQFKIDNHDNGSDHPLSSSPFHASSFANDAQEVPVPVLSNSLGSMACSIVSVLALKDFETRAERDSKSGEEASTGSMLFLAKVHGVEGATLQGKEEKLPLVYWNQLFTSVKP
jgi:flavin reductase (DIM6/NTAB) family NADH-FMN oxidoreductase RutF